MLSSAEKIRERFPKDRAVLWFLLFCIWILNLEEPAARFGIPVVTVFRNLMLVLALMVPALSTIGLFWVQKTILMRNMIMAIAGIGVGSYGVYTFVTKGIFG